MRTSGGAGASPRRLRDAAPGALHPLVCLLLALSLCCSLVAADAPSQWSPQLQLESHVTVGNDGIATSRGAGRQRSDGLSITRSVPVDTSVAPDAAVDDQAIKFTPPRVELGRMETCSPQRYYVGVENRGRVSVRLDGADFTHDGFSLATDVRGIRLDPGDRFNLQFVFLPSEVEPNGVDAHLRVLTTSGLFALPISSPEVAFNRYGVSAIRASVPAGVRFGQSLQFVNPVDYTIRITEIYALDSFVHIELLNGSKWIGPRWPKEEDAKEARQEVPGEYDKELDYARRADRGAWDMPAGTTSPLIKVSLLSNTPGVYFTHIHIAAGNHRLLLVPVHITVLKPGIHIEPKELDLGF
ncbi:Pre-mRNA-splicing factor ini1 [Phytophthora cinnamomi]|uniref:Pre-mRNA-splicing factor ini1 n=1 Tax=Phytophthora cinnamomi TaxID=4785 RepID=UPI00355A4123|nr:Pre-mRNA-splicing factor ini1 [Phytophthora cinnamomi]